MLDYNNMNGMKFTTIDNDNDHANGNCATRYTDGGAWWHNSCFHVKLTGIYCRQEECQPAASGIIWNGIRTYSQSFKYARMSIKEG